ncbi:hypothetical protein INF35_05645 [Subdoligranulum sp. DSM 109015]|uniref:Portal protein n=1 Tax=Gemmiger gallinarum TaxID=2779354 RepID=A0ABR9R296_9FIRM|nr:hypothetical protein [Gemmiger gallinarum]MBE5037264.1 hypothetical protein [Gemmiger gallinarum]
MNDREALYMGTHDIRNAKKGASNVRNITYELIESQVDSSIPQPKVTAIHEEDQELARQLETLLRNEARRLNLLAINDKQERTVPIQGGDFFHIEWNPAAGYHCTLGDVDVTERHPRQVIPQPGIYSLDKMDYVFVLIAQSKRAIEERYNVTIEDSTEEDPEIRGDDETTIPGMVTQNIAYYKKDGKVGVFSWVWDTVLEDYPDYYARMGKVCSKCGRKQVGDRCVCGNKKFVDRPVETITLTSDLVLNDGTMISAMQRGPDQPIMNPDGSYQRDDATGELIMMPGELYATEIPAYKPSGFPIVLRQNISAEGRLLGISDVDVIADQQEAIKKFGTKIEEKLLKGGSYLTLPRNVNIETSDREIKKIPLDNPSQKSLIDVYNVQPNTSYDQQMLETNYSWAKSALGITDAFQGKYDSSATSGSAKQFSANQSAGRLQSKREMKNDAYAQLYRKIFQFLLAYADENYPITEVDSTGEQQWSHFDRMQFLKRDASGELYWNDEFIIEVDPASNLASNRERLWDMIDVKYQAGGFGPINELDSQYLLWTLLKNTNFPYAGEVQKAIKQRMEEQKQQEQQMAQMQGGGMVDMG